MIYRIIFIGIIIFCCSGIEAQQLKLIYPQDNSFVQNDSLGERVLTMVKWSGKKYSELNFKYSLDNGQSWAPMIIPFAQNDATRVSWILPDTTSEFCKVKLSLKSDSSIYVMNNSPFTIFYIDYNYFSSNEIFMRIGNNGMGSHNPIGYGTGGFLWPGGDSATISAIFVDGLVWGGKLNGQIRVNGNTYRNGLSPGKILKDGTADNPASKQSKIFKIRKDWQTLPEGVFKDRLKYDYYNWPIDAGAPWDDVNEDGVYTPGFDKPKFIGDETLFYVANDLDTANSQYTYGSDPIGLEIQTTVFGFNRDDLRDVVFKKYKVINKSKSDITDMYFSYWTDDDLGYPNDDFIGCDTLLNLGFTYNGDNYDETGYGTPPPSVGHLIVQPPILAAEPTDSARFGDGWKRGYKNLPLSGFTFYISGSDLYTDPELGVYVGTIQMYNNMQGLVWDGANFIDPDTNLPTHFCLAGDPVTGTGWYEGAGFPGGPPADERRFLMSIGKFNMAVEDTQEVVIAFLIKKGTDNINSVAVLKDYAAQIQHWYDNEFVEILNTKQTIAPTGFKLHQNYPNPFNPKTTIEYEVPEKSFVTIKIYDILGREVQTLINNEEKVRYKYSIVFDASSFASGVYFYRIQAGSFTETKKMILLK